MLKKQLFDQSIYMPEYANSVKTSSETLTLISQIIQYKFHVMKLKTYVGLLH